MNMVQSKIEDLVEQHIEFELDKLGRENVLLKRWIKAGMEDVRCAVCGEKIEQLSIQRMMRPVLWHSRKCFRQKPKKVIKLEEDFGMSIEEILRETTARCGSIKAQCNVLDISIPYLYSIIRKYVIDKKTPTIVDFMAKYSTGKRKELYAKKVTKTKKRNS